MLRIFSLLKGVLFFFEHNHQINWLALAGSAVIALLFNLWPTTSVALANGLRIYKLTESRIFSGSYSASLSQVSRYHWSDKLD